MLTTQPNWRARGPVKRERVFVSRLRRAQTFRSGLLALLPRVRSVATGLVDVLRLVFPAEQKAIKVGDVTACGTDISTSSFSG